MERQAAWSTTIVALLTAALVGGGALLWQAAQRGGVPWPLWFVVALATVAAIALARVVANVAAVLQADRMRALARQVEMLTVRQDPFGRLASADPDHAPVVGAMNGLLERIQAYWDEWHREAVLGHSYLEQSPSGVLVVRPDGRVRYVNPSARRMVPIDGPAEGRLAAEVVRSPELVRAIETTRTGGHVDEISISLGRFDLLVRPVRLDDGGVLLVVQDVTRLRAAERARTDFVANVSHELRTPMATIMGYAETLAQDRSKLEPDTAMMVDAVHRNARRLRDLFEDLLELARIEARKEALPLQRDRLLPILERAVAPAADAAARKQQELSLDCDEELVADVNAEALTTIVRNLVSNATAYTPERGHVRVSARREGKDVVVAVADDGIGIDPAHHERIFERFYRVDEGRSRRAGGTGLGLAIVKHLALASGARITLRSAPGQGSTFSVHLPAG